MQSATTNINTNGVQLDPAEMSMTSFILEEDSSSGENFFGMQAYNPTVESSGCCDYLTIEDMLSLVYLDPDEISVDIMEQGVNEKPMCAFCQRRFGILAGPFLSLTTQK